MEDIDKNGDGFIDLDEYIGKSCFFKCVFKFPVPCVDLSYLCPCVFQVICTARMETQLNQNG